MREIYPNKIRYTRMYLFSSVCFFSCIGFGIMLALALTNDVSPGYFVFLMLGSAILGIFLRIRIRYRVFIDRAGIHIYFKYDGHELLLPRGHFVSCNVKIPPSYRAASTIILSREQSLPADLWYITCTDEFIKRSDAVKYGLEPSLDRLIHGKISEADLLEQPVIMLQFDYVGKSMQKFYRRFQEIWGRDTTPQ